MTWRIVSTFKGQESLRQSGGITNSGFQVSCASPLLHHSSTVHWQWFPVAVCDVVLLKQLRLFYRISTSNDSRDFSQLKLQSQRRLGDVKVAYNPCDLQEPLKDWNSHFHLIGVFPYWPVVARVHQPVSRPVWLGFNVGIILPDMW